MSQKSQCPQCGTQAEQNQIFCPGCGASMAPAAEPNAMTSTVPTPVVTVERTTMAPQEGSGPQNQQNAQNPITGSQSQPYSYTGYNAESGGSAYPDYLSNSNPEYPSYVSTPVSGSSPYTSYNTPPAPPPPSIGGQVPPPPAPGPGTYSSIPAPGTYPFTTTTSKRPTWFVPALAVLAFVVVVGAGFGIWSMTRNSSTTTTTTGPGGNNTDPSTLPSEQKLNLNVTYASVEFTFTSLEQKDEFADDSYTQSSYGGNKNWIRVNFKEKLENVSYGSIFSYSSVFALLLPDGQSIKAKNAKEYSGPQNGVNRVNWVDFGTSEKVDLSQLKLRLGDSDEKQFEFPLKDDADLSAYEPKVLEMNQEFKYARCDWKLTNATQTYYFNGKQAKNNEIFILVELSASNSSDKYSYIGSDFLRLKAGESTVEDESGSNLSDLSWIEENTVDIKGWAIFAVTPTEDNKYTLIFQQNREAPQPHSIDLQF